MLMYNLLSLIRPYEGLHSKKWYQLAILGGRRPSLGLIKDEGDVSLEIQSLIKQCWDPKWNIRPSFDVIESILHNDNCRR